MVQGSRTRTKDRTQPRPSYPAPPQKLARSGGAPLQTRADAAFRAVSALSASVVLILLAAIFVELARNCLPSIKAFGLRFLTSQQWNPVTKQFGAASSVFGTLVSTAIAMLIAVPLSIVIALFLVELAPRALSRVIGAAIELLAAIPSIIYGMWGVFVFAPFMAQHVQPVLGKIAGPLPFFQGAQIGNGMLTAGIVLALMVLPFVCAVTRDVFGMVPAEIKESAYGMGATTWEATRRVTIRYGLKGIVGAAFLGLGRALGETMAVTFVIGNTHQISASLFAAGNTIASTMANEFAEAAEPIYLSSLIELGLVLYLITFLVQIAAQMWLKRLARTTGTVL
jgi:phosphate transport system permease protein